MYINELCANFWHISQSLGSPARNQLENHRHTARSIGMTERANGNDQTFVLRRSGRTLSRLTREWSARIPSRLNTFPKRYEQIAHRRNTFAYHLASSTHIGRYTYFFRELFNWWLL